MNFEQLNVIIKDEGDILFAENDRRSKYVRILYTPMFDSLNATEVSLFRGTDLPESLNKIDLYNELSVVDHIKNETKPKTVAECVVYFMRNKWKLPSPQLIISVSGGAHLFKLPTPRARLAFQRGLIAAAVTTDAWIITAGGYSGVMKEVGDAVDKHRYKDTKTPSKVQCIGIGSWYYTTDHQQLDQQRSSPSELSRDSTHLTRFHPSVLQSPPIFSRDDDYRHGSIIPMVVNNSLSVQKKEAISDIMQTERTKIYRSRTPELDEESCPLDPNHTHFILLDDRLGENGQPSFIKSKTWRADLTIQPRVEIEHEISKTYSIPIIQILANGGPSSVLTVCRALQQETPVIVIEGTGRAADEFARAYRYLYGNHPTKDGEKRSEAVYHAASSKFKEFKEKIRSALDHNTVLNHTNCDEFIRQLTSHKGYFLISIFQFHNEQGEQKLDDAILRALFDARMIESEGHQRIAEFKLAMAWNKFDRIQRNILTDKTIFKWIDSDLDKALLDALRTNKIRCADLLIEYGASFDRLRSLNQSKRLYQEMKTNVLPYSQRTIKKIHTNELLNNWSKPFEKYFYEDYLDIDPNNKQKLSLSWVDKSITKYGILDDDNNISTDSESSFDHSICIFNAVDMVQVNGFLNTISIRFRRRTESSVRTSPVCYFISPTDNPKLFLIVLKCKLHPLSTSVADICHYKPAEELFVSSGLYIAIGFTHETGFPCNVLQRNQHSLELDPKEVTDLICAGEPIEFHDESAQGAAISFNINPSSAFVRDLFFWSLFFNRDNMATYLCSKCPHTTIATLIASKIYHQAAKFTKKTEDRLDFIEKEKEFDRHASALIDMYFDESDDFALDILEKDSPFFFDKNPLELASDMHSRAFLATKTVQRYLDQQWYGHCNEHNHNKFWIGSLIFIMCFIPILIPIPALSKFIISEKRQIKPWEKKKHIIGWSARIFYRFKEFYSERAIVQFYYNIVFYIFFLALFSFVLLVGYFPINIKGGQQSGYKKLIIPIPEIFLHILMWGLIFEEGNQFVQHWQEEKNNHSRLRHFIRIRHYFMLDRWNILDVTAIIIYLIGFITRFILIEEAFIVSKILMCIDLFLWYIRLLHIFSAFDGLGPKLWMIFNTMKDLLFFICFILIFLVAYSVTSYSLIMTNHQVFWKNTKNKSSSREFKILNNGTGLWNWRILTDIVDWGTWKIFGQVDLHTFYYFDKETKITLDNDAYGTVTLILTIFFVTVANILLLSVLVALFNVTIQRVHNSAHETWAYHRFLLVMEYKKKSFLPPPFNIFIYIFHLLYLLYRFFKNCLPKKTKNTYGIHSNDEITGIDSNLFNMVVFNGEDRIRHAGLITSVTINFSSPPLKSDPSITLYLLTSENNNPNMFFVVKEQPLPTNILSQRKGIQTIDLDNPLECDKNQFVALAFGDHSGSPASVKNRNEHSVNLAHFVSIKDQVKSIHFTNYPNKGAAFSFIIEQPPESRNNRKSASQRERILVESIPINEWTGFKESHLLNQSTLNISEESSNLTITTQNKFEERDNMLRESSIAEDYWKQVIDKIKQKEAKMFEEENHSINLSSFKSTQSGSEEGEYNINNIATLQNENNDYSDSNETIM